MRWREARITILLKVAGLGRSVGGRVWCVSPCLCLRRCLCLCLCLCVCFVYPAQGPGGETSVKARKGHHAHTLPPGKDWLCRCLLPQGSTTSDGAGSECGDGLELEPLEHLPYTHRTKQTIVVLLVVPRATPGPQRASGHVASWGVQGRATCERYTAVHAGDTGKARTKEGFSIASQNCRRRRQSPRPWERLDICAKSSER